MSAYVHNILWRMSNEFSGTKFIEDTQRNPTLLMGQLLKTGVVVLLTMDTVILYSICSKQIHSLMPNPHILVSKKSHLSADALKDCYCYFLDPGYCFQTSSIILLFKRGKFKWATHSLQSEINLQICSMVPWQATNQTSLQKLSSSILKNI